MFHILRVDSAAVRRIESSGDQARHETGSAWSRKTFSSEKLFWAPLVRLSRLKEPHTTSSP